MNDEVFLNNLNKYHAPELWHKYAGGWEIGPIWLVDDTRLPRSVRIGKQIFINIRKEYWKNYKELFNAQCYEESVVLKFLHEVGHIINKHKGDPELKISPTGINEKFEKKIKQTPLKRILDDPYEKEAWDFALNVREKESELYQKLLDSYKDWYEKYPSGINY